MKDGIQNDEVHIYSPMKAMRRKCLDCCCGSPKEVELCPVTGCPLFDYRFGKRPGQLNGRRPRPKSSGSKRPERSV